MSLRIVPITPRGDVIDVRGLVREVERELDEFAGEMIDAMAKYPPAQPWRHPPPRRGPRRRIRGTMIGRRTGRLGRGWRLSLRRTGEREVSNRVPYAVYVQGDPGGPPRERQVDFQRARGWQNIRDESRRLWRSHEQGIADLFLQYRRRRRRRL